MQFSHKSKGEIVEIQDRIKELPKGDHNKVQILGKLIDIEISDINITSNQEEVKNT